MIGGDIKTARQARQALDLREDAGPEETRRAFRAAVRKAHPDRGGDAEALRRVIDAHRLLKTLHEARLHLAPARIVEPPPAAAPKPRPPHAWPLEIDVVQAVCGGEKEIRLPDGRAGRLMLPAGLRPGDTVRLKTGAEPILFRIAYASGALEAKGDDLWMTLPIAERLLETGGEIEVEAPTGRKLVIVAPGAETLRLSGQGLPARGAHARGHLFIRLEPVAAQRSRSCARDLLRRFAAAWAA